MGKASGWKSGQRRLFIKVIAGTLLLFLGGISCLYSAENGAEEASLEKMLPSAGGQDYPVYLYFLNKRNGYLASEARRVQESKTPKEFCRRILEELIAGPRGGLTRAVPKETGVRAVYMDRAGTLYVDFSPEISEDHPGGVRTEMMTVFSVVNTLVLNSRAVDRVKLVVDGREADTLAGHVDIRFPLNADMLLVR